MALDFYSATCPPCRALASRRDRMAAEYAGRTEARRLGVDEDMDLARRFGVTSLPTLALFAGGKEVARLDGLITGEQLASAFARLAA